MDRRTIERRLEILEAKYGLDMIKAFISMNYDSEVKFKAAIEDFKEKYPKGEAVIIKIYNPETGELGFKREMIQNDNKVDC